MNKAWRLLRHLWFDASDTHRAVPDDLAERLQARIAASEGRHTGEVRLCVEASLPWSTVWRITAAEPLPTVVRGRALEWFGLLGVWDTDQNNGVLIYLLLAERTIEIVADRGVSSRVPAALWQAMADRLGQQLRAGAFEEGLTAALAEVSVVLVEQFPALASEASGPRLNQLPNVIVRA